MWSVFFVIFFWAFLLSRPVLGEDDQSFQNTVYLIRNGETNTKKLGSGLSPNGTARADCLVNVRKSFGGIFSVFTETAQVFGVNSDRPIGYIIAEPPKRNGKGTESIDTASPLAASLNMSIDISWYAFIPCLLS